MKIVLLTLICSILPIIDAFAMHSSGSWMDGKIPSISPEDVPTAHTVALSALADATAIEIEGPLFGGFRKDFNPIVINVHFTIKRTRTIRALRNLLVRGKFHKDSVAPGQEGARPTIFLVRFVVTTTDGGKIPFFVIEGNELRVMGLQTSVSDQNRIFRDLHKLLLRAKTESTGSSAQNR